MLVSRHGTPTHRLLVKFDDGHGNVFQARESLNYTGCEDWRFEPLNMADMYRWRGSAADPLRVAAVNASDEVTVPENNQ